MDPTPYFVMGMMTGVVALLLIQFYANRKVRKATRLADLDARRIVAPLDRETEHRDGQIARLQERLAVLERINTDPAERTARAIDALR